MIEQIPLFSTDQILPPLGNYSTIQAEQITLNIPQMLISLSVQKNIYLEGGRGLGKSYIVSTRIKDIVEQMPRSKCAIVGRTYEQLLTRTLPSTLKGLKQLGFIQNLHYFVGTAPPKKWKFGTPYEAPLSHDYCITFFNGTTFQLVSLDKTESGRGFNFDAVIGDEAALLDYEKLSNNVLLSMRGNLEYFGNLWIHNATLFVSTTPVTKKGAWFTKREELARQYPDEYMYLVAKSQYNLENLGFDYFKRLRRELLPAVYAAEVECIRNGTADKPFYPTFDAKHHSYIATNDRYLFSIVHDQDKLNEKTSLLDDDVNRGAPIDIALDYNAAICWLIAGQDNDQVYKLINAMYVTSPKTVIDLVQEFCDYYKYHPCKVANYYYDHTAVGKDALRTKSYSEAVRDKLEENGWQVNMIYCGQAPSHNAKKLFFERLYKETSTELPKVRMNQERCQSLILSIEGAGTKDTPDGIKKDKDSEKNPNIPPEEATHGSDAHDTLLFFKINRSLQDDGYYILASA